MKKGRILFVDGEYATVICILIQKAHDIEWIVTRILYFNQTKDKRMKCGIIKTIICSDLFLLR